MSSRYFGKGSRSRLNPCLILLLIISFTISMVPQNALSFQITATLEPPLFTAIPTIPVERTGATADTPTADLTLPADGGATATSGSQVVESPASAGAIAGASEYISVIIPADPILVEDLIIGGSSQAINQSDYCYLVKLNRDADESQLEALISGSGAQIAGRIPNTNIYKISGIKVSDGARIAEDLESSPIIAALERDMRYGPERAARASLVATSSLRSTLTSILEESDATALPESAEVQSFPVTTTTQLPVPQVIATTESVVAAPATSYYNADASLPSATEDQYQPVDGSTYAITEAPMQPISAKPGPTPDSTVTPVAQTPILFEDTAAEVNVVSQTAALEVYSDSAVPTGNQNISDAVSVEPVSINERNDVPLMVAGSRQEPVEYSATVGEAGMKFAAVAEPGKDLVTVSSGSKGFALGFDNTNNTSMVTQTETRTGQGILYTEPSTGSTLLLKPDSQGLVATLTTATSQSFKLNLPLYGLFAELSSEGTIDFLDVDTGEKIYQITGAETFFGIGQPIAATLSIINGFGTALSIAPASSLGSQVDADSALAVPSGQQLYSTRFYINTIEHEVDPTGNIDVEFVSNVDDSGLLASLNIGGSRLSLGATDDAVANISVSRKGSFTEFTGGAGSADIRFKKISNGLEQEIVLSGPPATGVFTLPIELGSLTTRKLGKEIELVNGEGVGVGAITASLMYDSRPASEGGAATSQSLAIDLETSADGKTYLAIAVDEAWLNDPARIYPVFIDPTILLHWPGSYEIVNTPTPTIYWSGPTNQQDAMLMIARDEGHDIVASSYYDAATNRIYESHAIEFYQPVFGKDKLGEMNRFTVPANSALPEGRYYWRVFATDIDGSANWSEARVFYVNTTHITGYYGSMPGKLPSESTITVPITVKNRGTSTWNSTGSDRYALSYSLSWKDSANVVHTDSEIAGFKRLKTVLPCDVPAGAEVTLNAKFDVPLAAGAGSVLTVKWDMLQEGICWFSERGEGTFDLSATVQDQWNVEFEPLDFPTSAVPGSNIDMRVKVTNKGQASLSLATAAPNTWRNTLVYAHLVDGSNRETDVFTSNNCIYEADGVTEKNYETTIDQDDSGIFDITLQIPADQPAGAYLVKFDLYVNGVDSWSLTGLQGVQTYEMPIMISAFGAIPDASYHKFGESSYLNLISGNLVMGTTDFNGSGRGPPIVINRSYNSLSTTAGVFGVGWSSILDSKLEINSDVNGAFAGTIGFHAPDGAVYTFFPTEQTISGITTYAHPTGFFLTLKKLENGSFELVNQDESLTYKFTSAGKLDSIIDNNANAVNFDYDANGRISTIDAADGSESSRVEIVYDVNSRVNYLKVPSSADRGFSFRVYGYDSQGRLIQAVYDPPVNPNDNLANTDALEIPVNYSYDSINGRLVAIDTVYGSDNEISTARLAYDTFGRLINIYDPRYPTENIGTEITYSSSKKYGAVREITNARDGKTAYNLFSGTQVRQVITSAHEPIFSEDFSIDLRNWAPLETNIALNKIATASGQFEPIHNKYEAANVTDGAIGDEVWNYWLGPDRTDYAAYRKNPDWVEVDLGQAYVVSSMRFLPTHEGSSLNRSTVEWHISVSNDHLVYTDVARGALPSGIESGAGHQAGSIPWVEVSMSPSLVRYVRFYVDSFSYLSGGLNELQVYGLLPGAQPSNVWTISDQTLTANLAPNSTAVLVSRDSYSDFRFEAPIVLPQVSKDVSLIFRETNNKTNFTGGTSDPSGYYLFRASGYDHENENATIILAKLFKYENGIFTEIARNEINAPIGNYKLTVEAIGPDIKCYLDNNLVIEAQDWTYTRGHLGFRAANYEPQNVDAVFSFGSTGGPVTIYGRALTEYSYDDRRNLVSVNSALKTEFSAYDEDVFGWDAQLPENRWSLRAEGDNSVIYANDMDDADAIWFGDTELTNYTVEAKIKIISAGAKDNDLGGYAALAIRSNGDPNNGYQYAITPNDMNDLHIWKMNNIDSGKTIIDLRSTQYNFGFESTVQLGEWRKYRFEIENSTVSVFLDDHAIVLPPNLETWTDSSIASGKIGLVIFRARALFDDVKITDADGNVIKYDDFQPKGLLTGKLSIDKVNGLISGEKYSYDVHNRPLTVIDQNKKRTTVTRDEHGNAILVADSTGTVIMNSYDAYGNLLTESAPVKPTYNFVPNPSCDQSKLDWIFSNAGSSTTSWDTTTAYDGTSSIKLHYDGSSLCTDARSSRFPVKPGEIYTVSAYVKTDNGAPDHAALAAQDYQNVFMRFYNSGQTTFLGQNGPEIPSSSGAYGWRRISKTVVVPAGAYWADVDIALGKSNWPTHEYPTDPATVYVDAIQVEEGANEPSNNLVQNPKMSDGNNSGWMFNYRPEFTGEYISGTGLDNWTTSSSPNLWYKDENGELSINNPAGQTHLMKSTYSYSNPKITAKVKTKSGLDVALAFRIVDDSNMYIFRFSALNGTAVLQKQQGTILTTLATATFAALPMDTWFNVEVDDASSGHIICKINETTLLDITENPAYTGSNPVGLRVGPATGGIYNHHHFDDVVVEGSFADHFTPSNPHLQLSQTSDSASGSWTQILEADTVTPGANYMYSANILTSADGTGAGGSRLHVQWKDSSGNVLAENSDEVSSYYQTGGVWMRKAVTVLAPANASSAILYLEQSNFAGISKYDDVRFENSKGQGEYSLIGNGSFESYSLDSSGKFKFPVGWTSGNPSVWEPASNYCWDVNVNVHKFGSASMQISYDSPINAFIKQEITVKPNTSYLLSGWIKTAAVQSGSGAGALLDIMSGDEHYITTPVVGDTDWSLQTLTFTTGEGVSRVTLFLRQGFDGGSSGTSWFDGVELVEKSVWVSSNKYDQMGNFVIEKTDPLGAVTTYALNSRGQKTAESSNLRSADGTLTPITTNRTYDNAGRELSVMGPAADPEFPGQRPTESATYDKSGNILSQTAANGAVTTYIYDASGRAIQTSGSSTQLFVDDFSGGVKFWNPADAGKWALIDNTWRTDFSGAWLSESANTGDEDWSSFEYQADVKLESGYSAGLEFLVSDDPDAGLLFAIAPAGNTWLIASRNVTWGNMYSGAFACDFGVAYTLRALVSEGQIELYAKEAAALDWGPPLWTGSFAGFNKGKIGLRISGDSNGGAGVYDNVIVKETIQSTRTYDNAGFVQSDATLHADGSTAITYIADALGRVSEKNDQGRITRYSFDELGNTLTKTDALGNTARYVYDSSGACATFDRLGNITSSIKARNADNLDLSASIDARGGMKVDKANATGIVATTDERNNSVNNTYSTGGSLASRVDALYAPYMFDYDVTGKPAVFTDPLGARTIFSRDSLGRLVTRTDGRGVSQSFAYDQIGRTISRTDNTGTTLYEWDYETGALIKVTNADGSFVSYTHDQTGNMTGAIYSDNKSALYGQSSYGGPSSVRDQSGGATSYSYDQHGQLSSLNSSYYAPGSGFSLVYDASGNVISETNPDGTVQSFTYDAENRMTSYNLTRNGSLLDGASYTYDANGNRIAIFDKEFTDDFSIAPQSPNWLTSDSSETSYWSQATDAGNSVYRGSHLTGAASSVRKHTTLQNYSFSARVKITEVQPNTPTATAGISIRSDGGTGSTGPNQYYFGLYPAAETTIWRLWEFSNSTPLDAGEFPLVLNQYYTLTATVETLSDASCRIKVYIDGALQTTIVDATPRTGISMGFRVRNVTAYFDDASVEELTTYIYDAANQLTKVRKPDNSFTTYAYDANGNRTSIENELGATNSYTYDAANRLIRDVASNSASSYVYDANGNNLAEGVTYRYYSAQDRLIEADTADSPGTPASAVLYTYDALGRVISRAKRDTLISDSGSTDMVDWSVSDASKWSVSDGDGNRIYICDSLTDAGSAWRHTATSDTDYIYNAKVKIISIDDESGTAGIIIRSDSSLDPSIIDQNEYYFGLYPGQSMWKLRKVIDGVFGDLNSPQTLDPIAAGPIDIEAGQYYLISVKAEGASISFSVNGEEKVSITDPSPHLNLGVGLRARAAKAYFDDIKVKSLETSTTGSYRYNDKSGALMHELDAGGNITASYVADAHGRLVSVTRALNTENPSTFFYHYNAHGDVVAITGSNGAIVAKFSYDPWGTPAEFDPAGTAVTIGSWTASTGGTPGDGLFILFGGMLYDAAAGLYLTKTRAYNPKTGRFLQRDILDEDAKDGYDGFPFGKDAIGTNLYAWCNNNPVTRVDPMGTFSFSDFIRRGARAVINIARGIGAGYSGAPSGGSGGAYGFGYWLGSGARAGAKMVAAVVEAVKPLVTVRTAVAARAPSREAVLNNLRNLSVAGIGSLNQGVTGGLGSSKRWEGVGLDLIGIWGEVQYEAGMAGMVASRGACWKACGSRITGGLLTSRGATVASMTSDGQAYRDGEISGAELGLRVPLNVAQIHPGPQNHPARQFQLGLDVALALNDDLGIRDNASGAGSWLWNQVSGSD